MAFLKDEKLRLPRVGTDPQSVRQRVEAMEQLLERMFVIPGTKQTVGLDVILDLVPVVGDIAAAALGAYIVWEGRNVGMSKWHPPGQRIGELAEREDLPAQPAAAKTGEVERAHGELARDEPHRRLEVVGRHPEPVHEHGMPSRHGLARDRAVARSAVHAHPVDLVPDVAERRLAHRAARGSMPTTRSPSARKFPSK